MPQRPLLAAALLVFVLACGLLLTLMAAGDAAPPAFAGTRTNDALPATLASSGGGEPGAPNEAPAAAAQRTTAGEQGANVRPFPEGAGWLTITVVDKETKEPAAGATVRWFDESAWTFLEQKGSLTEEERGLLMHDGERLADQAGWRTTADAMGRARVTVASETTVLAQVDDRFGALDLRRNALAPTGGHRLELEPDRSVQVQVVDERGDPCCGVPLTIVMRSPDGEVTGSPCDGVLAVTEAPHGIATIRHLQSFDGLTSPAPEAPAGKPHVEVRLPGLSTCGAPLPMAALPVEPIVLRLPPCGSVRVRGEFGGRPLHDLGHVGLYIDREEGGYETRTVRAGGDGSALFDHVPLGLTLVAWAQTFGGVWSRFAGPVAARQRVDVVMSPGDAAIVLRGRVLDQDRSPLADRELCVRAMGARMHATDRTRTDANGRFEVSLGQPRDDAQAERLWIECTRDGELPLRAVAAPRILRSGIEDLGDLFPNELPLIAAGRIEGADAATARELTLLAQRYDDPNGRRRQPWRRVDDCFVHVDEQCAFTIRGTATPGRHRLAVEGDHVLPVVPVEFTLGAEDLLLTIERGTTVAASVLLPPDAPPDLLCAQLVPAATISSELQERLATRAEPTTNERHDLRWLTVPAGTYTLELRPWAAPAAVLRLADVQVPGPEGGDARLLDMDLRTLVRTAKLAVVDHVGQRIESGGGAVLFAEHAGHKKPDGFLTWHGDAHLLLPAGPADLLVCFEGYRPQRCRSTGADLTVRLDPWPTVRVTFPGMPQLGPDVAASAALVPTARTEGNYTTQYDRHERSLGELLGPSRDDVTIVDGSVELPIGDGEHRIEVTLRGNARHEFTVRQPAMVLPTSSHVTANVPAVDWQKALEAAAATK